MKAGYTPQMARSPQFFALLKYDDPEAAIEWLVRVFGFTEHFVHREGGLVVHAQLRLGDDLVMLSPATEHDRYGLQGPRTLPGQSQCVCVAIEDVDGHYKRAVSYGAEIITSIADAPWGARLYMCKDLEGHVWSIGNYWGEPLN